MALLQFKHLLPDERPLWQMFLNEHGKEYHRFEYDVHVGILPAELQKLREPYRKGAEAVYLKRIDAVGFQTDNVTIFEVKPRGSMSGIGQIIAYMQLYDEKFDPRGDLRGAMICERVDETTQHLLQSHDIDIYTYPVYIL